MELLSVLLGGVLTLIGVAVQGFFVSLNAAKERKAKSLDAKIEYQRSLDKEFIKRKFEVGEAVTHQFVSLIQQYGLLRVHLDRLTMDRGQHEADFIFSALQKVEKEIDRIIELGKTVESSSLVLYFEFDLANFLDSSFEDSIVDNGLKLLSMKDMEKRLEEMKVKEWDDESEREFQLFLDEFFGALKATSDAVAKQQVGYANSINLIKGELRMHQDQPRGTRLLQ
jgi:hypothetical protein